jgi:hypothetical protein
MHRVYSLFNVNIIYLFINIDVVFHNIHKINHCLLLIIDFLRFISFALRILSINQILSSWSWRRHFPPGICCGTCGLGQAARQVSWEFSQMSVNNEQFLKFLIYLKSPSFG